MAALKRGMLKAMGIEDDKADEIISAHMETVDAIKNERDSYREKYETAKSEFETAKQGGKDMISKAEYEKLQSDFETFKTEVDNKAIQTAKEKAVREFYKSKGMSDNGVEIAMRGSSAEIAGIELQDNKIKDTTALENLCNDIYAGMIIRTETKGAETANPPESNSQKHYTVEDIKKMSVDEINKQWEEIKTSLKGE